MLKKAIIFKVFISLFFLFADAQLVQANNSNSNDYSINNKINSLSIHSNWIQCLENELPSDHNLKKQLVETYKDYLSNLFFQNFYVENNDLEKLINDIELNTIFILLDSIILII